jgi:hypothetical protein
VGHFVGDAPQEQGLPVREASRPHHDQRGVDLLGQIDDLAGYGHLREANIPDRIDPSILQLAHDVVDDL